MRIAEQCSSSLERKLRRVITLTSLIALVLCGTTFLLLSLAATSIDAIVVQAVDSEFYGRLATYLAALALVMLVAMLLAYRLSSGLQRAITRPIVSLAEAAQVVSEERDYTARVPEHPGDELGLLVRVFNDMLSQIELRDAALQEAHDELEKLVRERTAELRRQVSERLQAENALQESESQLRQSQKMEAVGRLAGGIAHDFNNLLTAIMGYTAMILRRLEPGDPLMNSAEEIRKAGARASDLTRQLLAFSRKQVLEPRVLELNNVITNMEKMLCRLIGEKIELTVVQTPDLGCVEADPGQIAQVVMNLCVNARDAMPCGGQLTIEAANVDLLANADRPHADMEPGAYVVLQVSDTGCGMPPDVRSRIFEPFYTTKEKGKGTGLGLSTVYGIIRQSGGQICVDSEPGRGTTFRIYLPRVNRQPDELQDVVHDLAPATGHETVLLVEDEDMVRELAREILEMSGYHVLEAPHGGEALMLCERYEATIDIMITDVVMPHLNGRELYERLAPFRPEMKVLYISGYTNDAIDSEGVLDPGTAFLPKPFTPEQFARKVRSVLDEVPVG